jgi:hypothetical protein
MSRREWVVVRWSWCLVIGLVASGCSGPGKVTVKGTVHDKGQPVKLSKTGRIQVTLVPVGKEHYTTYLASVGSDGSFKISDVPVGKYRVAIEQWDPDPQHDKLKGVYSVQNSKIIRDVDGQKSLDIDLADIRE